MHTNRARRFLRCFAIEIATSTAPTAAPKIGILLKSKSAFWLSSEKGALAAGRTLPETIPTPVFITTRENLKSAEVQALLRL